MKYIYTLFLFFFAFNCFAQIGKISGKLTDGTFLDPIPFANIQIKGTTEGTTTDFDGVYGLELVPGEYTLVYSFLGYETIEIAEIIVNMAW